MANPEYFTPKPRPSPANAAAPSLKGLEALLLRCYSSKKRKQHLLGVHLQVVAQ